MYEVHQRGWNSGVSVATIFKSNDLKECEEFVEAWNNAMDLVYEGKHIGDEYYYFASVYNTKTNKYSTD